jgi:capsular polysaccharide biosynthesis protein
MKKYFESDDVLSLLWRWKKQFVVVFLISFIGSTIFSSPLFIKPKYKSFAQVYPTNLQKYSDESATEQMLQMLESDIIREAICSQFELDSIYDIEKENTYFKTLLYREYSDNVKFKKTKHESVEISVLDTDPERAYNMVNAILERFNVEVKRLQDEKLIEAVFTIKEMIGIKSREIHSLEKEINIIRRDYGILDYGSQVKSLSREYYRLLARGNDKSGKVDRVKTELDNLKKKGVEYERLSGRLWVARDSFNSLKLKYETEQNELQRTKEYTMDFVNPYKADKKTYPVRWLIVLFAVGSSLLGALGVVSFMDRINKENLA